jgi:glycerol-3-phosphate dehydrogenase (NAD(P)+)
VKAAEAVRELAGRHDVEMPIMEQMYQIVHEGQDPSEALRVLMAREPKAEEWS